VPPAPPPTEVDPVVRIRDVGRALGLPAETQSFDVAIGHLDADGIPDVVIGYHGHVGFYLNHRPGLELVFESFRGDSHGCAIGDVNADGLGDVYCVRGAANGRISKVNRLWVQQPSGKFLDEAPAFGVTDPLGRGRRAAFVDLDHANGLDLVVANEPRRQDGQASPNRVFVDQGDGHLVEGPLGTLPEVGGLCVQGYDQDGDSWQDVLICGGAGRATPGWNPNRNVLHLYRNQDDGLGGRRLVDVAPSLGVAVRRVQGARLAQLDGDGLTDLAVVTDRALRIFPGRPGGRFGPAAFTSTLSKGAWVAVGQVDGRFGPDLYVVQECTIGNTGDVADRLLLDRGPGWRWTAARLPRPGQGCGDVAEAVDLDGDGLDEFVVGNGRWGSRGPIQVLTAGTGAFAAP